MKFKMGKSTREAYGEVLRELGRQNPAIVALDADLSKSTMSKYFAEEFPDRFFNIGIAEANMVGIAAGLARCGKIPFASSFACFVMCKAFDQLRMSVAYPGTNVKIVGSHGGISLGEDGASQMAIEDIALASALPGFIVVVPADEVETGAAVRAVAEHVGPAYIRVGRPKAPIIYEHGCGFVLGKAMTLRDGTDVTVIANGLMVSAALEAADTLAAQGVQTRVLDLATVKPLDELAVLAAAAETRGIVVAEEHLMSGGLGSAVAMSVARQHPTRMAFVAINDCYAESGKPDELFAKYGLTPSAIVSSALRLLD